MSTLTISNLNDGTTTVPTTFVTNGSAKFYINFNGIGTAVVNKSLNHSSLTDNGTGDFTFNFTNSMDDIYYSHIGGAYYDANTNGALTFGLRDNTTWSGERTASLIRYHANSVTSTSNRSVFDPDEATLTIHGDLA